MDDLNRATAVLNGIWPPTAPGGAPAAPPDCHVVEARARSSRPGGPRCASETESLLRFDEASLVRVTRRNSELAVCRPSSPWPVPGARGRELSGVDSRGRRTICRRPASPRDARSIGAPPVLPGLRPHRRPLIDFSDYGMKAAGEVIRRAARQLVPVRAITSFGGRRLVPPPARSAAEQLDFGLDGRFDTTSSAVGRT